LVFKGVGVGVDLVTGAGEGSFMVEDRWGIGLGVGTVTGVVEG